MGKWSGDCDGRRCSSSVITMGNSISNLVRTTNAWLHAPATLRGGYVLAWGMTFGFQVWQSFIGGVVAFKTRTFRAPSRCQVPC